MNKPTTTKDIIRLIVYGLSITMIGPGLPLYIRGIGLIVALYMSYSMLNKLYLKDHPND